MKEYFCLSKMLKLLHKNIQYITKNNVIIEKQNIDIANLYNINDIAKVD